MSAFLRPGVRLSRLWMVFLVSAVLGAGALAAQQVRWLPLGPAGGPVRAVAAAANGRTVYAGTAGGMVWKSVNRGRSWVRSDEGLRGTLIDLQNAEVAPGTVYALTTEGVFASFDAARTWTRRSSGLPDGPFDDPLASLVVAPSNPAVLYVIARTKEGEFFSAVHRVYRSRNGGASWTLASRGLPPGVAPLDQVFDLAVDPGRPQVAYAATSHGLFKTTDGGGRWNATGLTEDAALVAVDGVLPDRVYAVAFDLVTGARQIQVSADGGRTWTVGGGIPGHALWLETHPTRQGTAYAFATTTFPEPNRLFETTDGGQTWNAIGASLPTGGGLGRDLAIDPIRPDVLYAAVESSGTDPGLFRSGDGGDSFRPSAAGIVATGVTSLAFQPGNPHAVFAGLADGVHRLDVATGVWTQLGLDREPVGALAVDPAAPDTFYAAADSTRQLYRSTDGGLTWQLLSTDAFFTRFITSLTVVNGVVWAGGQSGNASWDPATGLWQERGGAGKVASTGAGPAAHIWKSDNSGLDAGGGIDRLDVSLDAGANFTPRLAPGAEILDIALLEEHPDHGVLALGAPGLNNYQTGSVALTSDGGATWRFTPVAPDSPPVFSVVLDPDDPQRILAGTRGGTVFESLDGGATWHGLSRGLARGSLVNDLVFDPLGNLYAATLGGGVFRLRDRRP